MINARLDQRYMIAALGLAERGIGVATPNVSVGCVIVKAGCIIGRGWTQAQGSPHAEFIALRQAGAAARGATLYTTLEPCAHISTRGPSCSDEIIASGISRVVMAARDPDARTNGLGKARLEAAGISVTKGVEENAAAQSLYAHFLRTTLNRVAVTLKIATSLDGFMTDIDGTSNWITGEESRRHVHLERARHDAILVGAGTLRADNPKLDVRLPGLEHRSPVPIIISNASEVPSKMNVALDKRARSLAMPDPRLLLESLAREGFLSVLVEGGPSLAAQFINADMVDRLLWYRAPIFIGSGKSIVGHIDAQGLDAAHGRWRETQVRRFGPDTLSEYKRIREI
jgi:diaminohydroxyphosphoribosylaminopyrimidine deaminase / 5-amino-6-(5-phosphoribosylamino)uracil reductase